MARPKADDYQEGKSGSEETGGITGSMGDTATKEGTAGSEESGGIFGSQGNSPSAERENVEETTKYNADKDKNR